MLYVPTHLMNIERDQYGWPKGVTHEQKEWLINFCRVTLEQVGPASLHLIYDIYKYKDDRPKLGILIDYTLACLDRALREVANQCWDLKD